MDIDLASELMGQMFSVGLKVASPILLVTLATGILISIFQVVTQIQEMTLTFVPKIFVSCATLYLLGNWMLNTVVAFATSIIEFAGTM